MKLLLKHIPSFYNLTETSDISKAIDQRKLTKTYNKVAKQLHGFDIKENFSTAIYRTVRDGMYVGYTYTDGDHTFMMPLDIRYCRIFPLEYEDIQEKPSCRNEHAFPDAEMKLLGTF